MNCFPRALFTSAIILVGVPAHSQEEIRERFHEVTLEASFYTADALRTMTLGAIEYTYHLNRTYWFGADFSAGPTSVDIPNGLNVADHDKFMITQGVFYMNLPALLGVTSSRDKGLRGDLYTAFGLGSIWVGHNQEVSGMFGGGLLLHTPVKWFAARFDLKGYFYMLDNTYGSSFNSDIVINLGPSFIF